MAAPSETDAALTIQDYWNAAEENFRSITGKSLSERSSRGISDVMSRLDDKYGSGKSSSHARTRKVIENTIQVIQLFGGLAVQGASMVFGPAQLCFNAVSFLLEIPGRIDKVFGSVGTLFEELDEYMTRLRVYQRMEKANKISPELMDSINKILTSFVDVCAIAYGLAFGSSRAKIKAGIMAAAFNDDSGVSAAIKSFNNLVNKQTSRETLIILERTLAIDKTTQHISTSVDEMRQKMEGLDFLVSTENTRSLDKFYAEQREQISQKLQTQKEVVAEQDAILKAMQDNALPTGVSELRKDQAFLDWVDLTSEAEPVLVLSGERNSGKSYLVNAIINEMEDRNGIGTDSSKPNSRVLVAYHFFQRQDDRATRGSKRDGTDLDQSVETAFKHICLQLAKQSRGYTKDVAATIKTNWSAHGRSAQTLWNDLSLGRPRTETVHVLLFDGVDQISEASADILFNILESLTQSEGSPLTSFPGKFKIRVLLSAASKSLPTDKIRRVPVLDVGQLNTSNVVAFINRELDERKILQEENSTTKTLADFIRDELPKTANSDFSIVLQALKSVRAAVADKKGLENCKQALVEACLKDPITIIPGIVKGLNQALSLADIERLNHILMWLVWGVPPYSIEELRAISFLHSRDDPLQSFGNILKTTYSEILIVKPYGLVEISQEMFEYFAAQENLRLPTTDRSERGVSKISMEVKISNVSSSQVKKFFWNLNEQINLEQFFSKSLDYQAEEKAIQVFEVDSGLAITLGLLELLNDEPNEITEPLFIRALGQINKFLRFSYGYRSRRLIEDHEVRDVLTSLIYFLDDTVTLDKHDLSPVIMREAWLDPGPGMPVHVVRAWLEFDERLNLLKGRDRRTCRELLNEKHGPLSFYRPIALLMAKHWLQSEKYAADEVFGWIDSYIDASTRIKVERRSKSGFEMELLTTSESRQPDPKPKRVTRVKKVQRAVRWVKENLPDCEENLLWYRRLADTYNKLGKNEQAIEAYGRAKSLDPDDWLLYKGCGVSYAGLHRWKDATLEVLKGLAMVKARTDVDFKALDDYGEALLQLAVWCYRIKDYEAVVRYCEEGMKTGYPAHGFQYFALAAMAALGNIDGIRALVKGPLMQPLENQDGTKLVRLMEIAARCLIDDYELEIYDFVTTPAFRAQLLPEFLEATQQAAQLKRNQQDWFYNTTLRMFEILILLSMDNKANLDRVIGIAEDTARSPEIVRLVKIEGNPDAIKELGHWHSFLASLYFKRVLASIQTNSNTQSNLEKLEIIVERSAVQSQVTFPGTPGLTFLVGCNMLLDRKDKAQKLLLPGLEECLGMLSNDTPDDDPDALVYLARLLTWYQDDYNALTAWSLLTPFDAEIGLDSEHMVTKSDLAQMEGGVNREDWQEDAPFIDDVDASSIESDSDNEELNEESNTRHASPALQTVQSYAYTMNQASNGHGDLSEDKVLVSSAVASLLKESIQPSVDGGQTNGTNAEQADDNKTVEDTTADDGDTGRNSSWMRYNRSSVSPKTLEVAKLPWVFDPEDEDFVLVQRHIDLAEQRRLFTHTQKELGVNRWLSISCTGNCDKFWLYASNFWVCKFCEHSFLCGSCLEKVKNGHMVHLDVCDPHHQWLHVAPWSNQYFKELGRDRVRVGGEIGPDGRVVGGHINSRIQWLAGLRKQWGASSQGRAFNWEDVGTGFVSTGHGTSRSIQHIP